MASRKEQKEALRREREAREQEAREAEQRRRMVGYGAAAALALAAIVVAIVLLVSGGEGDGGGGEGRAELLPGGGEVPRQRITDLGRAASTAGCTQRSRRSEGREHTGEETVRYAFNPPASGNHAEVPAEDGAYDRAPPDTAVVHSLEHGRVVLWFKPSLPRDARADLKALFDKEKGFQLLIVPRSDMPYDVAATAWGREPEPRGTGFLLGCERLGERTFDALKTFIDEHRGSGPEPVP